MLLYIICLFLIPLLISVILFNDGRKSCLVKIAFSVYISNIILNYLFFMFTNLSLLNTIINFKTFILIAVGQLLCCGFMHGVLIYKTSFKIFLHKYTTIIFSVLFTNVSIYFLWLLGASGRMNFATFLYNLITPINTSTSDFASQTIIMVSFMLFMSFCIMVSLLKLDYISFIKRKDWKQYSIKQKLVAFSIPALSLFICLNYPYYTFHLEDAQNYLYSKDSFIEENYVDPDLVKLSWPDKKRNLIYIFVESFESSYFSKDLGGLNDENLLPNLNEIMKEGYSFSSEKNMYGGAVTMPQAEVTISGMVASLGGINYKLPINTKDNDIANVLPGLTTLNDLLAEQGYNQYFMIGTYVNGYNIGPFYRKHGEAKTVGLDEKIEEGDLPVGYKVWWGFEDSKLYEFAKDDLLEIANSNEPFMYTITTNDTHREKGYTDESCQFNFKYPMQNAIACTDQMLSDFLRWIMAQPFYENTTVVILGDHLGHEEEYVKTLSPQEDRRVFNLILNPLIDSKKLNEEERLFWAGDMFPTVLASLGVNIQGDRLALGANLFSDQSTLLENYGREAVYLALEKNSDYYARFLSEHE